MDVRLDAPFRRHVSRPWGGFEQFALNEKCSVKILHIEAGERLSLQSHRQRSEWWICLDGAMEVEVNGVSRRLEPGEDVFIPLGATHRAIGTDAPCRWLEIAYGEFDEEDIERFEDSYGRVT